MSLLAVSMSFSLGAGEFAPTRASESITEFWVLDMFVEDSSESTAVLCSIIMDVDGFFEAGLCLEGEKESNENRES